MVGRVAVTAYTRGDGDRDRAFVSCAKVAAGGVTVVLSKLGCWTFCHRFPKLAVLAATPPSLVGGDTAATPRSMGVCLTVGGIAAEGFGASMN